MDMAMAEDMEAISIRVALLHEWEARYTESVASCFSDFDSFIPPTV
jgi:hypothetical protein